MKCFTLGLWTRTALMFLGEDLVLRGDHSERVQVLLSVHTLSDYTFLAQYYFSISYPLFFIFFISCLFWFMGCFFGLVFSFCSFLFIHFLSLFFSSFWYSCKCKYFSLPSSDVLIHTVIHPCSLSSFFLFCFLFFYFFILNPI